MANDATENDRQIGSSDPWLGEFTACFSEFDEMLGQESERGSVIVAAALLDDAVQQLIQCRLIPSPEKVDELFNGSYAPLSGFSAKIDFGYRIGVIGAKTRSVLHFVRKIRNDFAHTSSTISFESQRIHSWILEIFKLNKQMLDLIWKKIEEQKEKPPEIESIIHSFDSEHGVDYFIKTMGWRGTFELLMSMIAANLCAQRTQIEPLEPC